MADEFVIVKDLVKSFKDFKAVDGVSFSIFKGEVFGLLGPNGAAKTTTIRMLSTVLEADSGDITIGGHSVKKDAAAVRSIIGVCPQELALYDDLSALDNMVFFGHMAGMDSKTSALSLSGNGSKEWAERGGRTTTTGWTPTCACPSADPVPCTVLDPFAGAGTTAMVAARLGRSAIGCELSPRYAALAKARIEADQPLLNSVEITSPR